MLQQGRSNQILVKVTGQKHIELVFELKKHAKIPFNFSYGGTSPFCTLGQNTNEAVR